METTIGNYNTSLWKFVKPNSVLENMRVVVANRLASSGQEWVSLFGRYNSGTYVHALTHNLSLCASVCTFHLDSDISLTSNYPLSDASDPSVTTMSGWWWTTSCSKRERKSSRKDYSGCLNSCRE